MSKIKIHTFFVILLLLTTVFTISSSKMVNDSDNQTNIDDNNNIMTEKIVSSPESQIKQEIHSREAATLLHVGINVVQINESNSYDTWFYYNFTGETRYELNLTTEGVDLFLDMEELGSDYYSRTHYLENKIYVYLGNMTGLIYFRIASNGIGGSFNLLLAETNKTNPFGPSPPLQYDIAKIGENLGIVTNSSNWYAFNFTDDQKWFINLEGNESINIRIYRQDMVLADYGGISYLSDDYYFSDKPGNYFIEIRPVQFNVQYNLRLGDYSLIERSIPLYIQFSEQLEAGQSFSFIITEMTSYNPPDPSALGEGTNITITILKNDLSVFYYDLNYFDYFRVEINGSISYTHNDDMIFTLIQPKFLEFSNGTKISFIDEYFGNGLIEGNEYVITQLNINYYIQFKFDMDFLVLNSYIQNFNGMTAVIKRVGVSSDIQRIELHYSSILKSGDEFEWLVEKNQEFGETVETGVFAEGNLIRLRIEQGLEDLDKFKEFNQLDNYFSFSSPGVNISPYVYDNLMENFVIPTSYQFENGGEINTFEYAMENLISIGISYSLVHNSIEGSIYTESNYDNTCVYNIENGILQNQEINNSYEQLVITLISSPNDKTNTKNKDTPVFSISYNLLPTFAIFMILPLLKLVNEKKNIEFLRNY